jgi:hypothetical protein
MAPMPTARARAWSVDDIFGNYTHNAPALALLLNLVLMTFIALDQYLQYNSKCEHSKMNIIIV